MPDRCDGAQHTRIGDENVEPLPALIERRAEPVQRVEIFQVAGDEGGFLAELADLVVELFQRALRARKRHNMGALTGQLERHGATDAARRARHKGDAIFERQDHGVAPVQRQDVYALATGAGEGKCASSPASLVIARSEATRQSMLPPDGLLRFARNDERRTPSPSPPAATIASHWPRPSRPSDASGNRR